MTESKICTCPSGDGSLVHPCPAHPAVEQAGANVGHGHVFPRADGVKMRCGGPGLCSECAADAYRARAALAHRAPEVCSECSDTGKVYDESGDGPWSCYACTGNPEVIGYANGDELDNMLDDRTAVLSPGKTSFHTVPVYRLIRAALAQPSPKCVKCGGTGEADSGGVHPWGEPVLIPCDCETEQAEAERPEVAEVAFVLRNIGAMDAEDIDGDNVDLRFEDAEGRDTGCDVSIVEYAEKAADLFEQHDRIVGALRAVITQLRQHKNDYMDAGQETYRALQNEIREREAEIARLDGLVSSRTTERDAALARVAEMEALMQMNFGELHTARNLLSRLSVSGVNVDAILGGQLQDLVIVPADATLEMVEALKRRLTVTNRGTLLNAGHALNASIAASPFAKKAPEPVMCPRCEGEGTLRTGIDESPSTICKRCDGVGTIAAAPGKEVGHE
ncbi:hypothetical protein [Pseudomonas aeruginosa]|uniref:hypothetical protein n=1 Tax=Pseudomonas aeruginosa TaxID=287 RepID=UPI0019205881|nr:hypothetical protein [Pseudomonas aeruginosa]